MEPVTTLIIAILSGVSGNVATAVAAAVANIVVSYLIERRFYANRLAVVLLTLFTAFIATVFSFLYLANPVNHLPSTIVVIFLTSVALWAVFFHVSAINYGPSISRINLGRWSVLSVNWVKSIDYIYLTLSTLSVLRIVVSAVVVGNGVTYFNALAAVFLGFAVALRLTRTSIEIFGWDKPRQMVT
jgi:hypothetical protein